jgi:hypothetical protein
MSDGEGRDGVTGGNKVMGSDAVEDRFCFCLCFPLLGEEGIGQSATP